MFPPKVFFLSLNWKTIIVSASQYFFALYGDIVEFSTVELGVVLIMAIFVAYVAIVICFLLMLVEDASAIVVIETVFLEDFDECLEAQFHTIRVRKSNNIIVQHAVFRENVISNQHSLRLSLLDVY
jgi:hypothetical protein